MKKISTFIALLLITAPGFAQKVPPSVLCPFNATASNITGTCAAPVTYPPATVTGTTPITVTYSQNSGTSFPVGTTAVTVIATNGEGSTSCTFNVTVNDNENPTIVPPADITVNTNAGQNFASGYSLGSATTSDNCGIASTTNNDAGSYTVGTHAITWTTTDVHGNTTTATQNITVVDNEPPNAICKNFTLMLAGGSGVITSDNIDNGSTDNSGIASMSVKPSSFTCANAGPNAVTLSVTDINGNTATCTATVTVIASTIVVSATAANVSCNGGSNGSITASASGGAAPYNYSWSTGATTPAISGIAAGTYGVTVTDASGCTGSGSYTITQPTALSVTGTVTNANCNGQSNGSITTSVSGGTSPYTYLWSTGATTSGISGRAAGTYNLTVTDAHGCTVTRSYTITQPAVLTATISQTTAVSGQAAGTIFHGYGAQSITLTATPAGGTAGYTYSWRPVASAATPSAASTVVNPASTTIYSVTVTDAHGCTVTVTKSVSVLNSNCDDDEYIDHDDWGHHCASHHNPHRKVCVCHGFSRLNVDSCAVAAHLAHGDLLGHCDDDDDHGHHGDGDDDHDDHDGHHHCKPGDPGYIPGITSDIVNVYPNPTNGAFSLVIPADQKNASMLITDLTGKIIGTRSITDNDGTPIQLSIDQAPSGIYLVKINAGDYSTIVRLKVK